MAIKHCPDRTYRVEVGGFERDCYHKVYSHPREYHRLDTAVAHAESQDLVLQSAPQALALRIDANGQYAANQPQLTRSTLWQWVEQGKQHVFVDHTINPHNNVVHSCASELVSLGGRLSWSWRNVRRLLTRQQMKPVFIRDPFRYERTFSLEALAKDPLYLAVTGKAAAPYLHHLRVDNVKAVKIHFNPVDFEDIDVSVRPVVIGAHRAPQHADEPREPDTLLTSRLEGFVQGIRREKIPYPLALFPPQNGTESRPKAL